MLKDPVFLTEVIGIYIIEAEQVKYRLGMCGMDFSSSVRFRFGFEKNRRFGSFFFVDHS